MPGIRIEDCNHPDGGYAGVIFDGAPGVTPRDVMIRRFDTQQNYLSENGWQSFEAHIEPDKVEMGDRDVYVTLGPQVTQHIEYGERIEIELVDTGLKGVASWPEISSYTGGGGGRGRRMMSSQAKLRDAFTPRPPPPPSGPPADTTAVAGGGQATVIAPRQMFPPPPPPGTSPPPPPPPPPLSPPPAKKGRGWIHALALLVCLVLVFGASGLAWQYTSCGGVWITDLPNFVWSSIQGADRPQTCPFAPDVVAQVPPPPPPPVSPPPPPVSPPPPPVSPPPPPPPVSPPPPPVSPPPPPVSPPPPPTTGQRSTPCPVPYQDACLDARAPPDLVADARDLFGQGSYDNGFTMIERAASRGYGPAMTAWAQLIDPATFQQGRGFTRPNPERAIELYTAAIAAGDTGAEPLRQALLQRLRAQAESGGQGAADARRILERFGRSP